MLKEYILFVLVVFMLSLCAYVCMCACVRAGTKVLAFSFGGGGVLFVILSFDSSVCGVLCSKFENLS
jgi:hypothetical protein